MPKKNATKKRTATKRAGKASSISNSSVTPNRANNRGRRLGNNSDIRSLALVKDATVDRYHVMYREIFEPGALDRKTKELIAIAAAAIAGCDGCLIGHIRKAKALGSTMDEMREAVGVAFAVNAATVVDRTDVVAAMLKIGHDE